MKYAIDVKDVSYGHGVGGVLALDAVSLSAAPGETVALLGASGAGKTTLLNLLDGRLKGWTGSACVLDRSLDPARPPQIDTRADSGFIFQEFALVERSTVLRNVLNGRLGRMSVLDGLLGRHSARDLEVARQALVDCGIAELAERRVDSLSGGQRQRVAIARCLAQEPRLILADEPVSSLDPARAAEILDLMTTAAQGRGATVVFSSHQPELAMRFADRVVGLTGGKVVFDRATPAVGDADVAALYSDTSTAETARGSLRLVM